MEKVDKFSLTYLSYFWSKRYFSITNNLLNIYILFLDICEVIYVFNTLITFLYKKKRNLSLKIETN